MTTLVVEFDRKPSVNTVTPPSKIEKNVNPRLAFGVKALKLTVNGSAAFMPCNPVKLPAVNAGTSVGKASARYENVSLCGPAVPPFPVIVYVPNGYVVCRSLKLVNSEDPKPNDVPLTGRFVTVLVGSVRVAEVKSPGLVKFPPALKKKNEGEVGAVPLVCSYTVLSKILTSVRSARTGAAAKSRAAPTAKALKK